MAADGDEKEGEYVVKAVAYELAAAAAAGGEGSRGGAQLR